MSLRGLRCRPFCAFIVAWFIVVALLAYPSQSAPKVYQVGIVQIVDIPLLREMREAFVATMAKEGFVEGNNITYFVKDAQGEISNAKVIAAQFASQNLDLVYALGTPAVQAMYQQTDKIPVLFGGMTDPVGSGVAKSLSHPGGHATGTTDLVPPKPYLDLMLAIMPHATRVGTLSNPSEANSQSWLKTLSTVASGMHLTIVAVPVQSSNDVQAAARSLVGRVDAIVSAPDNTVESAIAVVIQTGLANKIPVFAPEADQAKNGALVGIGADYPELGRINARQAAKILRGASPASMPVEAIPHPITEINLDTARKIGITIPPQVRERPGVQLVGQ